MTLVSRHNAVMNAGFDLWDYAESAQISGLPSHGYLANRWKATKLGVSEGLISRKLSPNTTAVAKWMRNRNLMSIDVTGVSVEGTVSVTQTVEDAVLWQRGLSVVTIVASGPDGATFDAIIGGESVQVRTRGIGTFVTKHFPVMLTDTTSGAGTSTITCFTNPSAVGEYQVAFIQVRYGASSPFPGGLEVRTAAQERALCARYARRVGAGVFGPSSATRVVFPVSHPVEMRVGPSFIPAAGSVAVVNVDSGAAGSNTAPVWSSTHQSTGGIRLICTGWTGLSVGTQMITTPVVGLLHADY